MVQYGGLTTLVFSSELRELIIVIALEAERCELNAYAEGRTSCERADVKYCQMIYSNETKSSWRSREV